MPIRLSFAIILPIWLAFAPPLFAQTQNNGSSLSSALKQEDLNLLAMESAERGDAVRGKQVFQREVLGCVKCHSTSSDTQRDLPPIGPDQSTVADRLTPVQIIESILFPNKSIAKGYESLLVLTLDGELHQGVAISQSESEIVLAKPDQKQLTTITQADVDEIKESKSSMPDGLGDQLGSRQDFYDLIKYLSTRTASSTGTEVSATDRIIVKEIPSNRNRKPRIAIAQPNGICYVYDPNSFHFESVWEGPLGWEDENGIFTLNQVAGQSFHIRENPWKIDVNKILFDFEWLGHEIKESGVIFRYALTDRKQQRVWEISETIEVPSILRQSLRFDIVSPKGSKEVLTYWLYQTNYRSVSSNGQQAQRNQLEFLHPGQTEFILNLSRRSNQPIMPNGYRVEQIDGPTPDPPFLFEPTSFSFANDGTAFVSTRTGGIWRYHDEDWNLFADGLHETLGIQVASNGRDVYTMQKPELTLLQDTDSDGMADFYESIESRFRFTGHYHEFAFGPVVNSKKEFFFSTGLSSSGNHEVKTSDTGQMSSALGYRGWVMRIGSDGKLQPFAAGLRSPAGIGMNAHDDLFITDNQGDWVASSYLGHVEEGDFLGHPASLWDREEYDLTPRQLDYKTVDKRTANVPPLDEARFRAERKPPAVWLIHGDLTNSPGNPSFCPPEGFGPFGGQAFIADISHRSIVRVALEKVNGVYQGAAIPFIRPLGSAAYSTRFDPQGRLWVGSVGRGWTTGDPIIEVISFDEDQTPFEMHRIELKPDGFDVHFTTPLAKDSTPTEQVTVSEFHYRYWEQYGSDRQDYVKVPLTRVEVSTDQKTLHIEMPVNKGKIYEIDLGHLLSGNGLELQNNFAFYTVNELAK